MCQPCQPSTFLCTLATPPCGGRPWDLVMPTTMGDVAGATTGVSSGPPTSPALMCCCCCAAVVVVRSSCVPLICIPQL